MKKSISPLRVWLQVSLLIWATFLPQALQASESKGQTHKVTLNPSNLLVVVPGDPGSANLGAIVHDSGEFCIIPQAKLRKRDGKVGKLQRIYGFWAGDEAPFEIKVAASGAKLNVKLANKTKFSLTFNESTGQVTVRAKGQYERTRINEAQVLELAEFGSYWFQTARTLINYSKSHPDFFLNPNYDALDASAAGKISGETFLQSTESAKLAELAWLITKVAGITGGIIAGGVALSASAPLAVVAGSVLGFGGAIAGAYDLIKFKNPDNQSDVFDGVVTPLNGANSLNDWRELWGDLRNLIRSGKNLLKSTALWSIAIDSLNSLLEKPAHALVNGMVLKILYTWPSSQRDLDTTTTFLGESVGYASASSSEYLIWTGDDTGSGGLEQVTCLISQAAEDAVLPSSFVVSAKAGWYEPAGGSGPAYLEMYLENPQTGVLYGPRNQLTIQPGTQSGAASTPVGSASFTWNPNTTRMTWAFD
ncbi:hypothetical protein HNR46_003420 [Haloferula luteola]|uniref:Uncharacterized protein n=1 Tax=Haloferula luteola TaxID=595692 RepID=A0A840V7Z2_9BACT|nr:hypothetical protein [Haloferula luteola]MBB5353166.1 hypothetical protein [Haloferula luteola]